VSVIDGVWLCVKTREPSSVIVSAVGLLRFVRVVYISLRDERTLPKKTRDNTTAILETRMLTEQKEVLLGIEPRLPESESDVLTITL
jgi:hypothetical protein